MRSALTVALGARSYEVVLAPDYAGVGEAMAAALRPGRCLVVSNPVVAPLHAEAALAGLRAGGWSPTLVLVPDGEENKNLDTWSALMSRLLGAGVDRRTPVVALGGGVTGDLCGFAAATLLRGVPFVQLPTTLLAMVDASVGGKTGVNSAQGKNLIGAFHQPSVVWAALDTLRTLPAEERRSGLGEVVKHAMIAGEADWATLEAAAPTLADAGALAFGPLVASSVRTKAAIVASDEREDGPRAILNLGHTLGHAIEAVAGYGVVAHGEAVALGMVAVTRLAAERGWLEDPTLPERLTALLGALGLPARAPAAWPVQALFEAAGFDKKRERGKVKLIVPAAPGRVHVREVPVEELRALARALPGVVQESSR